MGTATLLTALIAAIAIGPAGTAAPVAQPAAGPPAVAPSPGAADAANAAHPLKEIGRVRVTTPFCKSALEVADVGIDIALENDLRIANIEGTFRRAQLDQGVPSKGAAIADLRKQYVVLRASAVAGDGVMKRLKELGGRAPTAEQARAMLGFADALSAAIYRQKELADVIGRTITILENHPIVTDEQHERMIQAAIRQSNGYNPITLDSGAHGDDDEDQRVALDLADEQASLNRGNRNASAGAAASVLDPATVLSIDAATDLQKRAIPVTTDENTASDRIDAAFNAC